MSHAPVLDERRHGEVVKEVREELPDVGVPVLALALVIEAVHLRDLPRLVVAPQDGDAVLVPHFQGHQQRRHLHLQKQWVE